MRVSASAIAFVLFEGSRPVFGVLLPAVVATAWLFPVVVATVLTAVLTTVASEPLAMVVLSAQTLRCAPHNRVLMMHNAYKGDVMLRDAGDAVRPFMVVVAALIPCHAVRTTVSAIQAGSIVTNHDGKNPYLLIGGRYGGASKSKRGRFEPI